jgi:hypothetical protein
MPFTNPMYPSHRFQRLKPANSNVEDELGKRGIECVHLFSSDLPDGTNRRF